MNRLRPEQKWNRRLVWEYDARLIPYWKRIGPLAGGSARWQRIRDAYAAFVTMFEMEVAEETDRYVEIDWVEFGTMAGLERKWRTSVMGALVTAGLVERRDGRYRPNPDVRDHKAGFENAKTILGRLPAPSRSGRTARKVGQTARKSGRSAHPENASQAGGPPTGLRASIGETRSKTRALAPQNGDPENDPTRRRRRRQDVTAAAPPAVGASGAGEGGTLTAPGAEASSPNGDVATMAGGRDIQDDTFVRDAGPCVDCGYPLAAVCEDLIRHRRAGGTPTRWSHREIPDPCGP